MKYLYQGGNCCLHVIAEKFYFVWCLFIVSLSFLGFWLIGCMLWLTACQVIRLFSDSQHGSQARVRLIISFVFNIMLRFLDICGVVKIEVDGIEKIKKLKGHIIISNHPCLLDVVVILAKFRDCQCIIKSQLWKHPIVGGLIRSAGFIKNDLDPQQLLQKCTQQLMLGQNIIIFPEGTRSSVNQPLKLHRGVGNLAILAEANIQALIMECNPLKFTKQDKWYSMPAKKIILRLSIGEVFLIQNYFKTTVRSLQAREIMRDIQEYYNKALGYE
jgi:1-acyl-sn-glycerol-3-phosphate acyltransferase